MKRITLALLLGVVLQMWCVIAVLAGQPGLECLADGAASFDCSKARTGVELAICHSKSLGRADCLLGYVYRDAKEQAQAAGTVSNLQTEQLAWLKSRDSLCNSSESCLLEVTKQRASLLIQSYDLDNAGTFRLKSVYSSGDFATAPTQNTTQTQLTTNTTPSSTAYDDGLAAYKKSDYATALKLWQPLANQGNANAQEKLGSMYAHHEGIVENFTEAEKWYRLAADQGNADAQFALGGLYSMTSMASESAGLAQDFDEAVKWFRLAAAQGHVGAQQELGMIYEKGWHVAQDYNEALKWYRLAAEQGNAEAQSALGVMYEYGQGVAQDYKEALKWYRLAAAQGIADAQKALSAIQAKLAQEDLAKKQDLAKKGEAYAQQSGTQWNLTSSQDALTDKQVFQATSEQKNDQGLVVQITGSCAHDGVKFEALFSDDSGKGDVSIGGFKVIVDENNNLVPTAAAQIRYNDNEAESTNLRIGDFKNVLILTELPLKIGSDNAKLTALNVWRFLAKVDTSLQEITLQIPFFDSSVHQMIQSCGG